MPVSVALIDDDEHVRSALSSLIRSVGLDVCAYPSAEAFLSSGEQAFACLIADVQMPGMNGLELQRRVSAWAPPLPVIIMTAFPDRARKEAVENGAVLFVEKPVDSGQLVSYLESLLRPDK